jgi:conjugative transfer signal peptidase TraF
MQSRGLSRSWLAALAGLSIWCIASALLSNRQIVINTSPSVTPGLYWRSSAAPAVGQLIDFRIPLNARYYVSQRTGQNGEDWYILKPIVAGPGDQIDTTGNWLVINGRPIAPMPPGKDKDGHVLPIYRSHQILRHDEFFVFSNRIPNSFDSRCYGPISRDQVEAVRIALLTW